MSSVFGKRVVIHIAAGEENSEARETALRESEFAHLETDDLVQVEARELEAVHPEGLAGHPEIRSLQQWLDLNG